MMPGAERPELQELPRIKERISFLYLEHCELIRDDSGVLMKDKTGSVSIPVASISTIMLGPGTSITHRAMELISDAGSSVVWVGEQGVKYYAHGRPITTSSLMLTRQAEYVSNMRKRLAVAREMYSMRFPGEDVSHLTMQQLRGREGSRIRSVYRRLSKETGVPWNGRSYKHGDYEQGDRVNRALSSANACLYGVVQSVIVAMGCSPGLGFVHTGHERSFVYDIADLYKTETSIPVAFKVAASDDTDLFRSVRRGMRDVITSCNLMERAADDIRHLFNMNDSGIIEGELRLWDGSEETVECGKSYADDDL